MQFLCASLPVCLHLLSPDKALAYSTKSAIVFYWKAFYSFFVVNVANPATQAFRCKMNVCVPSYSKVWDHLVPNIHLKSWRDYPRVCMASCYRTDGSNSSYRANILRTCSQPVTRNLVRFIIPLIDYWNYNHNSKSIARMFESMYYHRKNYSLL